jgi:hypothetical protein
MYTIAHVKVTKDINNILLTTYVNIYIIPLLTTCNHKQPRLVTLVANGDIITCLSYLSNTGIRAVISVMSHTPRITYSTGKPLSVVICLCMLIGNDQ